MAVSIFWPLWWGPPPGPPPPSLPSLSLSLSSPAFFFLTPHPVVFVHSRRRTLTRWTCFTYVTCVCTCSREVEDSTGRCVGNLVYTGTSDPGILVRLPSAPPTADGRPRPRYREETLENGGGGEKVHRLPPHISRLDSYASSLIVYWYTTSARLSKSTSTPQLSILLSRDGIKIKLIQGVGMI